MIKTTIKHFVLERCIDVAFEQLTSNFINPNIQSDKVRRYSYRLQHHFPEYQLIGSSVVDLNGNRSRCQYTDAAVNIVTEKYYNIVMFNEIGSALRA